jgi:hypothetical protein
MLLLALPCVARSTDAITDAYRAGVAAVECDFDVSSELSSALGEAVQRIEQASGMGQKQLDGLWAKLVAEAKADPVGFCAAAAALIDQTLASAQ